MDPNSLSPIQKTAILVMSLPEELHGTLLNEFSADETNQIRAYVDSFANISSDIRNTVVEEFLTNVGPPAGQGAMVDPGMVSGMGMPGQPTGTLEFTSDDLKMMSTNSPFRFLQRVNDQLIAKLLHREHPQTIAQVLRFLQPEQAARVIRSLSASLQSEVARRIAELDNASDDVIADVVRVLEKNLQQLIDGAGFNGEDNTTRLVGILSQGDQHIEDRVVSGLSQRNPRLASDLRSKLCDFEDLANVDNASLAYVVEMVGLPVVLTALKNADARLQERVFQVMGDRRGMVRRDFENRHYDLEDIRKARLRVRNILRGLASCGQVRFVGR